MARKETRGPTIGQNCCEKPCCQELLQHALGGSLALEQSLERVLDHLERTP